MHVKGTPTVCIQGNGEETKARKGFMLLFHKYELGTDLIVFLSDTCIFPLLLTACPCIMVDPHHDQTGILHCLPLTYMLHFLVPHSALKSMAENRSRALPVFPQFMFKSSFSWAWAFYPSNLLHMFLPIQAASPACQPSPGYTSKVH